MRPPQPQQRKRELLARVHKLLKEASSLPRAQESWQRREQIDLEIARCFRQMTHQVRMESAGR